jgi:hypothetical protein
VLGLLVSLWLTYAVSAGLAGSPRPDLVWAEGAVVLPVLTAVILWALLVGPDQAGGGYIGPFVLAVGLTALLRLLLAARVVRKEMPGMLTKRMVIRNWAAA